MRVIELACIHVPTHVYCVNIRAVSHYTPTRVRVMLTDYLFSWLVLFLTLFDCFLDFIFDYSILSCSDLKARLML